jgi:hypothetical protein
MKLFPLLVAADCSLAAPNPCSQDAYLPLPSLSSSALPSTKTGIVAFAGVNIAGFDFGCQIDGTCDTSSTFDVAAKGSGIKQMLHFVQDDGLMLSDYP